MAQSERRHTYEEYLAFDAANEGKHEFVNGQILAMAGGSMRHSELAARMTAVLVTGRKSDCRAFQSDLRIRILATGRSTYPDASVICGPIERDPADKKGHTATNPTLIVEVLSPTTENEDRGSKWHHYMRIPSLKEYFLVSQDEPRLERYRRNDKGSWEFTVHTEGSIELVSGGILEIEKLYADLPDE